MKKIIKYNFFFIGLPLVLISLGLIFQNPIIFYGLLSTILTGIFQVAMGTKLLLDNPTNKYLRIYIISVILFFFLYFIVSTTKYYNKTLLIIMKATPALIAIYFTLILFKIKSLEEKEKPRKLPKLKKVTINK